ncbi:hypothetical protein [Methanococcus maripaludis]|uniref:Uncharacterized protein n=2 Tax=Methanococcus maripaludis TaxID=39152 RepID=A0A7J9PGE9_METMI|nr:hypothetical protein [Methanococcus maripaludis]MBA2862313.1 hypothetical protein [Methanococcus maripaludis]
MKKTTITSLIAAIVGGIYFETFFPALLITFYLLDNRFKNSFLYFFSAYLFIFGYFFNPLDFSIFLIIFLIIIPHLLVLFDLLIETKYKSGKLDIFVIICLISGLFYYEIYIFGIALLLIKRFNNYLNKKIVIILIPIIISLLIAIKYTDIVNQNLVYKILVLTGLGAVLYSIYSFLNENQEIQ